jgi:hypothetical protein
MRILFGITFIVVVIYFIDFHEYEKPACNSPEDFIERTSE